MADIIFSSSYDEKHPPHFLLNSNKKQFFSSTGMYPQEINIQFNTQKLIKNINISSYAIKSIEIQTCENDSAMQFVTQSTKNNIPSGGIQNISLNLSNTPKVKVLKIIVLEGYEDFFTIHSLTL